LIVLGLPSSSLGTEKEEKILKLGAIIRKMAAGNSTFQFGKELDRPQKGLHPVVRLRATYKEFSQRS
ncbi:MAG: hypothetical protein RMJ19_07205, partial [Gemmatales bacterium]|nr:hypothetical protein [Gemmatales bacterium]MDW8175442.1 hypothetical protein [Gemmatales bacterium]